MNAIHLIIMNDTTFYLAPKFIYKSSKALYKKEKTMYTKALLKMYI